MMRCLRDNSVVWYASDQSYGGKGSVLLPFFGEPAMTNTATTKLAAISGATVLPYFFRRLPGTQGYRVDIGAPLPGFPSDDAALDARRLFGLLESYIRLAPEQYLWLVLLNPATAVLESYQAILFFGRWPEPALLALALAWAAGALAIGVRVFDAQRDFFAEEI